MVSMRKQYEASFKAKVALEAIKGEKTIAHIASEFGVHPNQIRLWRNHLMDELPEPPDTTPPGSAPIADTSWIANGHPVPWVFSSGGRVEAKGLWTGTWSVTASGIQVTITHQGVSDTFTVKLAADGQTFIAYKNGQAYRTGTRQKK